jgi:hypothetical protein
MRCLAAQGVPWALRRLATAAVPMHHFVHAAAAAADICDDFGHRFTKFHRQKEAPARIRTTDLLIIRVY